MGEVIRLQQRVSQARSEFPPIVSQLEIDTEALAQRCAALTVKLRVLFITSAVISLGAGSEFWLGFFIVLAMFARRIAARRYRVKQKKAEELAMKQLQRAHGVAEQPRAKRFNWWVAAFFIVPAIIAALITLGA